jgi:cytidylate kinase
MKLLFLYGPPGVGKLTVAKHLCDRLGLRLFHNHLVVDLLTSVFEFGSKPFVDLREQIWLSVFAEAARGGASLVFTFAPERTVTAGFVPATVETVKAHGGETLFVELTSSREELERRVEEPSRLAHGKLSSRQLMRQLEASGSFDYAMPIEPALRVDTTLLTAEEVAARIINGLALA